MLLKHVLQQQDILFDIVHLGLLLRALPPQLLQMLRHLLLLLGQRGLGLRLEGHRFSTGAFETFDDLLYLLDLLRRHLLIGLEKAKIGLQTATVLFDIALDAFVQPSHLLPHILRQLFILSLLSRSSLSLFRRLNTRPSSSSILRLSFLGLSGRVLMA